MPKRSSHDSYKKEIQNIDVFILCGGQGTRLRTVLRGTPKALAPIGAKPFLDILIERLRVAGFARIILGIGYLGHRLKSMYKNTPGILFSEERAPLGTGGALKNAHPFIKSDCLLVVNGDSVFHGLDFRAFCEFHKKHGGLISMAVAAPRAEKDFGSVIIGKNNMITTFAEKSAVNKKGLMNGGVYVMQKEALELMPSGAFSLEHDFFPRFAGTSLCGFFSPGEVIDIGTPQRYKRAVAVLVQKS